MQENILFHLFFFFLSFYAFIISYMDGLATGMFTTEKQENMHVLWKIKLKVE